MRAKKFGVELSSTAKKAARSERFGLNNTNTAIGGVKVLFLILIMIFLY